MHKIKEQTIEKDEFHNCPSAVALDYYVMGLDKDRYKVISNYTPYASLNKTIDEISAVEGVKTIRLYKSTYQFENEFTVNYTL